MNPSQQTPASESSVAATAGVKSGSTTAKSSKRERKPTIKQKLAFEKVLENHGNVSKAMREAGYSDAMAKNPQTLTNSAGWQELLDHALPNDLVLKVHKEGLEATLSRFSPEGELLALPDYATRHKYLDTTYKLKGTYAPEKSINVSITLSQEEKEKLEAMAFKSLRELDA